MSFARVLSLCLILLLLPGCSHIRPGKRDFDVWAVHAGLGEGLTVARIHISDTGYLLRYGEDRTTGTLSIGDQITLYGDSGVDKEATASIWRSLLEFGAGLFSGIFAAKKGV